MAAYGYSSSNGRQRQADPQESTGQSGSLAEMGAPGSVGQASAVILCGQFLFFLRLAILSQARSHWEWILNVFIAHHKSLGQATASQSDRREDFCLYFYLYNTVLRKGQEVFGVMAHVPVIKQEGVSLRPASDTW